ncbi:O-antigen ligase [Cupriavidus gilardii J11]|uniref:O-antigen ligase n=1 Tax=Cupriavidus gilardii J11 TaxID=936133 RepID=A0A562B2D2_9BURK|nr:O-antigen ligase family protein [Cupriavidus gilardii]TWG79296.1 O-antigen ligase [Cupriavidus gilardii J11]
MQYTNRFSFAVAAIAAALSPALMLTLKGGAGYCYFAALAAGLIWLWHGDNRRRAFQVLRSCKWYLAAMAGYPLIIALQALLGYRVPGWAFDAPARLLLAAPILALLAAVPDRWLRPMQWGCVAGAVGAAIWSVVMTSSSVDWMVYGRAGNPFTNPIPFGNTALVLGFMGAVGLADPGRPRWDRALRLVGLVAGCYASYTSESRGGWLAIPVMLWILVMRFHVSRMEPRRALATFAAVLALAVVGAWNTPIVQNRIAAAMSDFHRLEHGDANTSIGWRLQQWRAASQMFAEHPVLGIGKGHFEPALREMAEEGKVPPNIVHRHAHNEFFSTLAELGMAGVAALFLLYFGSIVYFWRYRHSPDPDTATAAGMGLVLTLGSLVFGITIDVFSLVMNTAFYALTTATLLGIIASRQGFGAATSAPASASSASRCVAGSGS